MNTLATNTVFDCLRAIDVFSLWNEDKIRRILPSNIVFFKAMLDGFNQFWNNAGEYPFLEQLAEYPFPPQASPILEHFFFITLNII